MNACLPNITFTISLVAEIKLVPSGVQPRRVAERVLQESRGLEHVHDHIWAKQTTFNVLVQHKLVCL